MKLLYLILGLVFGTALTVYASAPVIQIINGGTGTTTVPIAQLLYGGASGYQSVATTTASCSGSASCSAFTVIGSSPITISASGGAGGSGTVSTSTHESAGQLSYWTTNSATPALLGQVATNTLTASGVVQVTNSPVILGGSSAAITVIGGANSQVLGWQGGVPAWIATSSFFGGSTNGYVLGLSGGSPTWLATTTFNSPLSYAGGAVSLTTSGAWSGSAGSVANSVTFNSSGGASANTSFNGSSAVTVDYHTVGAQVAGTYITSVVDPFTHPAAGQSATTSLMLFNGNASTTQLSASVGFFNYINATSTTASSTFSGPVGISTTSAIAFLVQNQYGSPALSINTASTTGAILTVQATSSLSTLFSVDQYGHLMASSTSPTPTLSTCGTNPSITATSNDVTGDFTTGTGSAGQCTITFGTAYAVTPEVFITQYASTTATAVVSSHSTSAFTVTLSSVVTGDDIGYWIIEP